MAIKKITFVVWLTVIAIFSFGQSPFRTIDRTKVEKAVKDTNADTYYARLLYKYNSFDTSLTSEDYRLLYYGFAFQKGYSGYADHKKKEISKLIGDKQFYKATVVCDSVLDVIPISLTANFFKGLALFSISENDVSALLYRNRYLKLREAILSSGNGLSCETAYKTLFVTDQYELLYNYFKVEELKGQKLVKNCDKLSIVPSKSFPANEIFFDTSETLLSMIRLMKDK